MALFRRGRRSEDVEAVGDEVVGDETVQASEPEDGPAAAGAGRERGPWDVSEVPGRGRRLDLGPLWLPGLEGMELRMEVEKTSQLVTAAAVSLHGSALQLQVFAAPRTEGIWDEIRAEIAESVTKQGGAADDLPGPFGRELLARVPVRTPDGRTGHRPARFIGHDGPRWFLRGVLTGRAAIDPDGAGEMESLFADVVVVRGTEARAPRELLPLRVPNVPRVAPPPPAAAPAPGLELPERGPEITEIH